MTFDKPTRPAPPMPAIKQPAIDYRALLVRYMAMVMDCEGVSFVQGGDEIAMTEAETAELEKIEDEASALIRRDFSPVNIEPRFRVFLNGGELVGVLKFGEEDGKKWVEIYDPSSKGPELATIRHYNPDFEFRQNYYEYKQV
ncbi:MAG: hypothetical protein V4641_16200 [Pseudomonadota bacterium]